MRKLNLTILVLLITICASSQNKKLETAISAYFPVLPFDKGLEDMIRHYSRDTNYVTDSVVGKSDTTDLYIRGAHKTFNPFSFKPSRVLFCVRETGDWIVYHITALLDTSVASKEIADKEVTLIHDKFRKLSSNVTSQKSAKKDPIRLRGYNYYVPNENTWIAGLGWSYIACPYFTGYFVVLEIDLVKKYIK